MPWTMADAVHKTKKATTKTKQKQWAATANAVLKKTGDEGLAVKTANSLIKKKSVKKGPKK